MEIEIWADVVCPWCLIGRRRFEKALAQFEGKDDVVVRYRSFQLDPEARNGSGETTAQHLMAKLGQDEAGVARMFEHVEGLATAEGLEYHLATAPYGNTLDVHRVLHHAAAQGRAAEAWERFYTAYFTENRSIYDAEEIVALAGEAGLAEAGVRAVLESDQYLDAVREDVREARELGANGVPFFVAARALGVAGAQPVETMLEMLRRAAAQTAA